MSEAGSLDSLWKRELSAQFGQILCPIKIEKGGILLLIAGTVVKDEVENQKLVGKVFAVSSTLFL